MRGGGLGLPDKTRHKEFGAVAAAWGLLEDLGVAGIIDQVAGPRPAKGDPALCERQCGRRRHRYLSALRIM
jgi:hypothetical protein